MPLTGQRKLVDVPGPLGPSSHIHHQIRTFLENHKIPYERQHWYKDERREFHRYLVQIGDLERAQEIVNRINEPTK